MNRAETTLNRINFDELGCHWLDPNRRNLHPAEQAQQLTCHRLLAEFVEHYGVKPFAHRYRNVHAIFKQSGCDNDRVRGLLKWRFSASGGRLGLSHGKGSPFDHVELWGRDRTPLFLIGHPYQITDEGRTTLEAIRAIGLVVSDYHPSWYGFGTRQIRVFDAATVRRFIRKDIAC